MQVICGKCNASFKLDDHLIKSEGSNVRCSKCEHVFKVHPAPLEPKESGVSKEVLEFSQDLKTQQAAKDDSAQTPVFKIIKNKHCPLYELGDEFQLSGKIFLVPQNKAPCLILAKDVMKILIQNRRLQIAGNSINPGTLYECTGCTGFINFGYKRAKKSGGKGADDDPASYIDTVIKLLKTYSIFKTLSDEEVKEIVSLLKVDKYKEEDIIIRKGEPGRNLFIIVSGKVEVVSDDGMTIAFMGGGEVFGEMSLLSGDPVGATIKVVEPSTILFIGSRDFKTVLNQIPTLQMNFTRLLARRMAEINSARNEEFASGMTGKLSEMPPAELFQTLNVNQKTGVLTLKLPKDSAYISFREGELVRAKYRDIDGENAFFELLKVKEGRFKFLPGLSPEEMEIPEIGDFMHLLMEGLRKIDEDDKSFLRTMLPNL